MLVLRPLLYSSLIASSTRRLTLAMSISTATTPGDQHCSGKSAVIFLHGLGDSPAGWSSLEYQLPSLRPSLGKDVHYVFPPAPTIGITINGGYKMPGKEIEYICVLCVGTMMTLFCAHFIVGYKGWFDLFDWPIGIDAKDDPAGKNKSAKQIEDAVEKLEKDMGIPPNRIVVGGFSQGGAVALLTAYHRRKEGKVPFAGCVCLSGWLTMKDELQITDQVVTSTPLFWGHGLGDDKVLHEQQPHGVKILRELGVDVTDAAYPMGHSSHPEEIEAMAEFLERVLKKDS